MGRPKHLPGLACAAVIFSSSGALAQADSGFWTGSTVTAEQPDNAAAFFSELPQNDVLEAVTAASNGVSIEAQEHGAYVQYVNYKNGEPEGYAIRFWSDGEMEVLKVNGWNLQPSSQPPLHAAAWMGHVPLIDYFLANGADLNGRDQFGRTPLFLAYGRANARGQLSDRQQRSVQHLISKGADTSVRDKHGLTAQANYDLRVADVVQLVNDIRDMEAREEASRIRREASVRARERREAAERSRRRAQAIMWGLRTGMQDLDRFQRQEAARQQALRDQQVADFRSRNAYGSSTSNASDRSSEGTEPSRSPATREAARSDRSSSLARASARSSSNSNSSSPKTKNSSSDNVADQSKSEATYSRYFGEIVTGISTSYWSTRKTAESQAISKARNALYNKCNSGNGIFQPSTLEYQITIEERDHPASPYRAVISRANAQCLRRQ